MCSKLFEFWTSRRFNNRFFYVIDVIAIRCKQLNIPVVGGNVSLYNSTDGKSIRPTPILLMMGIS